MCVWVSFGFVLTKDISDLGVEGGIGCFLVISNVLSIGGVEIMQHLWFRREEIWGNYEANKYQNMLLKILYFTIKCGRKIFLPF